MYSLFTEDGFKDGLKSYENPFPTIITAADNQKLIVFSYTHFKDDVPTPTVYFYDIESEQEIAQASGASIFLHHRVITETDEELVTEEEYKLASDDSKRP